MDFMFDCSFSNDIIGPTAVQQPPVVDAPQPVVQAPVQPPVTSAPEPMETTA